MKLSKWPCATLVRRGISAKTVGNPSASGRLRSQESQIIRSTAEATDANGPLFFFGAS